MQKKKSVKILIVDDEKNMRFLLKEELEEEGYEIYDAASGEEALEIFNNNKEIDVVTVDIEMPGMDGRELAGKLRKEKPEIKILFLTAYSHYKHDLSSWAADEYIVKSADLNELKNKIKQLLK